MMKWLVKKKSLDPSLDMITEDPLATLELGLAPNSPNTKKDGSSIPNRRRSKNTLNNNQIYSVSRTNPLFDEDNLEGYKSSSETSGYSSRDQRQEQEVELRTEKGSLRTKEEPEDLESTTSSRSNSPRSDSSASPLSGLSRAPYMNPDYVNRIIIDECELGIPPSTPLSLSPIGEETEMEESTMEDSIVTNSLLAMTSGSGEFSGEHRDELPPYIEPIDSRTDTGQSENMEKVIRELSEAVTSSRNVLSLTRAMGNKSKSDYSLSSSSPYSYADYKPYKNDRMISDIFRIQEVNGLQVVNLDDVPSMDPLSSMDKNKALISESKQEKGEDNNNISAWHEQQLLDVNALDQQSYWESYYGLQREIVIDGSNRWKRKGVLQAASNGPHRGFFTNNYVLESISQPSLSSGHNTIYRNKTTELPKNNSKNAFLRLIKSLQNSSCFWKSFWIFLGFTVVLIATIATSIYVTKSIIQKNR